MKYNFQILNKTLGLSLQDIERIEKIRLKLINKRTRKKPNHMEKKSRVIDDKNIYFFSLFICQIKAKVVEIKVGDTIVVIK